MGGAGGGGHQGPLEEREKHLPWPWTCPEAGGGPSVPWQLWAGPAKVGKPLPLGLCLARTVKDGKASLMSCYQEGPPTFPGAAESPGPRVGAKGYKSPRQPSLGGPTEEAQAGRVSLSRVSPRFAKYYRDAAGVEFRTLFKAYGIRFDVMVNGKVCGGGPPEAGRGLGGARLTRPCLGRRRGSSASSPPSSTWAPEWHSWAW